MLCLAATTTPPRRNATWRCCCRRCPSQRDAIVLTKVEGLSVAEAAERSGASVSAIKVQVHRGLKKLADLIRKEAP